MQSLREWQPTHEKHTWLQYAYYIYKHTTWPKLTGQIRRPTQSKWWLAINCQRNGRTHYGLILISVIQSMIKDGGQHLRLGTCRTLNILHTSVMHNATYITCAPWKWYAPANLPSSTTQRGRPRGRRTYCNNSQSHITVVRHHPHLDRWVMR